MLPLVSAAPLPSQTDQRPGIVIGCAGLVAELAEEGAGREVVGVDRAVAEVADEQRVVELAVALQGGPGHPPGGVELALAGEPLEQVPLGVEDVDEAVARAGDVVVLGGVLLGVGDVEVAVDGLDAERGVAGRDARVGEGAGDDDGLEVRVEDVDLAVVEVGGVEVGAGGVEPLGEPLVDGARGRVVDGDDGVGPVDGAGSSRTMVPSSVEKRKLLGPDLPPDETTKPGVALETWPVGAPVPPAGRRDVDDQGRRRGGAAGRCRRRWWPCRTRCWRPRSRCSGRTRSPRGCRGSGRSSSPSRGRRRPGSSG